MDLNKQIELFELLFVVLISREIVRQRRWRRLTTEPAGVDKLPDYLWSDTKAVTKKHFPAVIICLATVIIEK